MKYKRLISLLLTFLAIAPNLIAHEEPSKTLNEQANKAKTRVRIAKSGISKAVIWKHTVTDGKTSENGSKLIVQEYDRAGNMTAIESYQNDSLSERVEYRFDLHDNLLADIDFSPDGKILEKNAYQYDSAGRVLAGKSFGDDGQLTDYFLMKKATDKKNIAFLKYKGNDSLEYKIEYLYASDYDKSDFTEANKYDGSNKLLLSVYKKYDSDGQQTEKAVYGNGLSLSFTFYYQYGSNGYLAAIAKKEPDGTIDWKEIYDYDENGNCSEIKSFDSDGKQTGVVKFTYEYYSGKTTLPLKPAEAKVIAFNPKLDAYQEIFDGGRDSVVFYSGVVTIAPGLSGELHSTEAYEEMIVVLEGEGQVKMTGQKNLDIKFGNIAFIPPDSQHQVINTGTKNLKYIYIAAKSTGK